MKGRAATLLAGIAGTLALAVGLAGASTPPTSSITVPSAAGQTVSVTWTGTIPPGANPTNACTAVAGTPLADEHSTAITVPPGLYNSLNATFTFSITWGDALHDEILTVLGPGGTVVGSSDGGTNVETVIGTRLQSGTYRVLACPFAAAVPVTYTGKLEIRTEAGETSLPSAPADGLEFSASVAADNQRDESEPLVEIDRAGNIYACGPDRFVPAGRLHSGLDRRRRLLPPARHASARPGRRWRWRRLRGCPRPRQEQSRQLRLGHERPRAADRLRHLDLSQLRAQLCHGWWRRHGRHHEPGRRRRSAVADVRRCEHRPTGLQPRGAAKHGRVALDRQGAHVQSGDRGHRRGEPALPRADALRRRA